MVRSAAAFALALLLVPFAGISGAFAAPNPAATLPLELSVNGAAGSVVIVLQRAGDVFVSQNDLAEAGLRVPAGIATIAVDGTAYVSLSALAPAITYAIDERALMLVLHVPATDLTGTRVDLAPKPEPSAGAVASGFLTYDLATNAANKALGSSTAYEEVGAGSAAGVFTSSTDQSSSGITRGLTSYASEDPAALHRVTFGDTVAQGGELGSSIVLGGVSIARAYDLQPRFVQYPSAGISGTVLTPSTADVYVNGAYVKTVSLAPGPFSLGDLQLPTGANATSLVLHDATGATTTLQATNYVGADLLRAGLTDYEYDLGFARPDPFANVDRYGPLAAVARYRIGLTNGVTVGARFETQAGLASGGPRIDVGTPIGTLAAYVAASDEHGTNGSASAFAYVYAGRGFDVDLSDLHYSPAYADVAMTPGDDRRLSEVDARAFAHVAPRVTLELSDSNVVDRDFGRSQIAASDVRLSIDPRFTVDLTADRVRGDAQTAGWTIGSSLMIRVGTRATVTAQTQTTGGRTTYGTLVDEPPPEGPGFGYRLETDGGPGGVLDVLTAIEQTDYGDAHAMLTGGAGTSALTAGIDGSFAFFKEGIFAARPLDGAYALADTSGVAHLPVQYDGTSAGTTNGRGLLVIPNLAPYVANQIGLGDLSRFSDLDDTQPGASVIPKTDTGVIASLDVRRIRIVRGTVTIMSLRSHAVPAYGMMTIARGTFARTSDLGAQAGFYFENLEPGTYRASIDSSEGPCSFDLTVPASSAMITELGALVCAR